MSEPILKDLQAQAIRAHNWTSFSPEARGERMVNEYSAELSGDIEELQAAGIAADQIADYVTRYRGFFSAYLAAKGRCISSMITGPARFPVRRAEKANRSEHNHFEVFRVWRDKAKKAIVRRAQPAKTYTSEIDRYREELAGLTAMQELMKVCNAIIKKAKGANCTDELIKAGLDYSSAIKIQLPDWGGRLGYPSFKLTNNNANIKRVQERIKELEAKEQMRATLPESGYTFAGGEVVINYEADRIQIKFDTRPTRDELAAWKSKGLSSFNWSPTANAWQRKITPQALAATRRMLAI